MRQIVEKPREPISRLANIGLYYIRDSKLLFEGIHHVLEGPSGPSGEYFLTDAFQYMVDHGAKLRTAPAGGWYDCGKVETLIETNHHLLSTTRGGVSPEAELIGCTVVEPVRIEAGARLVDVTVGPNVTVEEGARVEGSELRDSIIGTRSVLQRCRLRDSIVGEDSRLEGIFGRVNVAAFSELEGEG